MTLSDAKALFDKVALELNFPSDWGFEFDNSKQRFGSCNYNRRKVTLSGPIVLLNEAKQVEQTIRHEIAHVLVGPGHGHDAVWKAMARKCGDDGARCYDPAVVNTPEAAWVALCPKCGKKFERHRAPKPNRPLWCGTCFRGRSFESGAALSFQPTAAANTSVMAAAKPSAVDPLTLAKIRALRMQGRGYVAIDASFGIHGKRGWWSWKIIKENGMG